MNSCLYECLVLHNRLVPRKSKFYYSNLMFYLDLDEIGELAKKKWFFSRNRVNIFNFRDKDHVHSPGEDHKAVNVKENIIKLFEEYGVDTGGQQIMLLTNVAIWGYYFNPVSFYFLVDEYKDPICAIVEINNKSGEQRHYFISHDNLRGHRFFLDTPKFYGSPFIENEENVHFNFEVPNKSFSIKIDDQTAGKKVFVSTMLGTKRKLSAINLFWFTLTFPFVTLRMAALLKWYSFKVMFKVIVSQKSIVDPESQREWYKPYRP